jgi:hypothetical protein
VSYTTAAALVNELAEAAGDKTLSRTIARYGRVDLLCLDLCRHRDYAEGLGCRLSLAVMTPAFLVVWPVLVSA